jgi:hypothetical protein
MFGCAPITNSLRVHHFSWAVALLNQQRIGPALSMLLFISDMYRVLRIIEDRARDLRVRDVFLVLCDVIESTVTYVVVRANANGPILLVIHS